MAELRRAIDNDQLFRLSTEIDLGTSRAIGASRRWRHHERA
jgi:hypothetical protein